MSKRTFFFVILTIFAIVQFRFYCLTFQYPVRGVSLEQSPEGEWVVVRSNKTATELQAGDVIRRIDSTDPSDYFSVIKWRTIDQAKHIEATRGGTDFEFWTKTNVNLFTFDILPFFGELASLLLGFVIFHKMQCSRSAQLLGLVFLCIGLVFMGLSASIRGDTLGKMMVSSLVMLLPVLFLHFLKVFFAEKGGARISTRSHRYMYGFVGATFLLQLCYFPVSPLVYPLYRAVSLVTMLFFAFGLGLNLLYLSDMYFKHRKENTHLSAVIRIVWFSVTVSFAPIICCSFLPQVLFGREWINSFVTGWFVLVFPVSFTYLIASKQLYDIDILLRRALLTTLLASVPSAVITFCNMMLADWKISVRDAAIHYILVLLILSFVLYSLEYFSTRLEKVMFSRRSRKSPKTSAPSPAFGS